MSFKRDGNDSSLLNCLKRRRVGDLLSSFIPSDEASLLKNGRYHCKVCHQGFVFDTLETLAQHRKGKKHLENLSDFLERKQKSLQLLAQKQNGDQPATSVVSKGASFRPSAPYDSHCMRKRNKNEPNRKICLNTEPNHRDKPSCTSSRPTSTGIAEVSLQRTVKTYLRNVAKKSSFQDYVQETRLKANGVVSSSQQVPPVTCTISTSRTKRKPSETDCKQEDDTEENSKLKEKMAYYAKLRCDGWKKNADGEWLRDEDAEFDSDEEPPQDYMP